VCIRSSWPLYNDACYVRSKYNGDAWDDFADKLPLALLHHINGNSVYNTSHQFMEHIVSELEAEAGTLYNAISYDYRISQILLEGSSGLPPDFPYPNILDDDGGLVTLRPKPDKFGLWWKEYGEDDPVKESRIINNFATTAFILDDVDKDVSLIHGKSMYLPWDPYLHGVSHTYLGTVRGCISWRSGYTFKIFSHCALCLLLPHEIDTQSVSLVVSDWGEMDEPYKQFLYKIDASDHPFSQIVLIASFESRAQIRSVTEWAAATFSIPVAVQNRADKDFTHMDLCEAKVNTDYFMMTDVDHAPLTRIDLMFASDGSNRPVVPYVPSESSHCSNYKACAATLSQAREFFPAMDYFMLSEEILFSSSLRQEFCEEWKLREETKLPAAVAESAMGPTPTSYIAYLLQLGVGGSAYSFSDAIKEGSRKTFVPADPKMPLAMKYDLVDVASFKSEKDSQLPLFWRIPRSGGTTVEVLLAHCLELKVASSSGAALERNEGLLLNNNDRPNTLSLVANGKEQYVNVDVSNPEGIARAEELDLVGSGLADVFISPLLHEMSEVVFSPQPGRRATVFAIFRHPVERAASLFYYLQRLSKEDSSWAKLGNMTIDDYAVSSIAESNWMVRMLSNEAAAVDERHLEIAKDVVRKKIVVGLLSNMEESMQRFYSYFGWERKSGDWNPCEHRLLFDELLNANVHKKVDKVSKTWGLLAANNALDVALYEYAVELFDIQGRGLSVSSSDSDEEAVLHRRHDSSSTELRQVLDLAVDRRMTDYPSSHSEGKGKGSTSHSSGEKCGSIRSNSKKLKCLKRKMWHCKTISNRRKRSNCVSRCQRKMRKIIKKIRRAKRNNGLEVNHARRGRNGAKRNVRKVMHARRGRNGII